MKPAYVKVFPLRLIETGSIPHIFRTRTRIDRGHSYGSKPFLQKSIEGDEEILTHSHAKSRSSRLQQGCHELFWPVEGREPENARRAAYEFDYEGLLEKCSRDFKTHLLLEIVPSRLIASIRNRFRAIFESANNDNALQSAPRSSHNITL